MLQNSDTFSCTLFESLDCLQLISQKINKDGIYMCHVLYVKLFWLWKQYITNYDKWKQLIFFQNMIQSSTTVQL